MDFRCRYMRPAEGLTKRAHRLVLTGICVTAATCLGVPALAQTVPPVETEVVREAPVVRKLELSGTVTSPHASQISTSVGGLVSKVYFDSGAHVKTGDLMLELDAELEEAADE